MVQSGLTKTQLLPCLILLLGTVSGCGTQELTRQQAADLIQSSQDFRSRSTTTPFLSGETRSISIKDRILKENGLVEVIRSGDTLALRITEKGNRRW